MKIKILAPFWLCLFVLTQSLSAQTTLINYGSSWSYFDNASEPADQGATDWNDPAYDASSWSSGNAHLGYGDGDEVTTINSNTLTVYLRHTFSVADASAYDNLDLDLVYDDGAVIYLNGTEVWRVNMPSGPITYNTFSATTSNDNANAAANIANALVNGANVLAVEVHQRSTSSSDISFDFRLTGNAAGSVNVTRGPYLQKASPGSMVIRWRTASVTETVVDYGTSLGNLNQQYSDLTPKTEHEVEITGLTADTRYYYEISNASTVLVPSSASLYFQTSPPSGTSQPLTVWVLGDCGTANNNQRNVRDAYYNYIGSGHTDAILLLGDNAYNSGTDNEYQYAIFENMYEEKLKNTVTWSCLGNHDGYTADSQTQTGPYYDIFTFPTAGESGGMASGTEAYYSFDYGNIHFISLDSYETDRSVGGAMYNWCMNDIQNTTQQWIVAFWHHPPYSKGSHDSDSESNLVQMRQNFLPMLESHGVDLVLSGHSHSYERSYLLNGHYDGSNTFNSSTHTVGATGAGDGRVNGNGAYDKTTTGPDAGKGAVYVTAGSSGKVTNAALDHEAMYYSVAALGSCILEVDGNQMDVKFIRETGAIEDYFTINKTIPCTPGTACDDGQVCTENDVYDANCNCVGTPAPDSDGDGVCDLSDQCPGLDDSLIGQPCDDGQACTENDVYDANCGCAGTPAPDSDGDGICDPIDQCPGLDDSLIGQPCDDGQICTENDVYDANCNCTGTPAPDSDGDGVCDALDQCPGLDDNLIGQPCDDGQACTTGDVYDANCNCVGTPAPDSDGDGVCDPIDQCPGLDDNLIGQSCNDGDDCTINDQYNSSCACTGDPLPDNDGDGFCGAQDPDDSNPCIPDAGAPACDPCSPIIADDFESGFGNWIDGGGDCSLREEFPNSGIVSVRLRDNSGASSSMYTNVLDMSSYEEALIEFSYYPNDMDNGEVLLLEISTNGGASYSIYRSWAQGTDFVNNVRYFEAVDINGFTFTNSMVFRLRCDASSNSDEIFIDDVTLSHCAVVCTAGSPCDDADPCTINDVYDVACNCQGSPAPDSDGDGVCDSLDQCPGQDDALIGQQCDDGIACTINDVYDANCSCNGVYTDADGDGLCIADDPDDNDGCNPDPNNAACNPCSELFADSFENDFGNWIDGGSDCSLREEFPNSGIVSVRLRDNSGTSSSMFTNDLDLSTTQEVRIDFSYYPVSMENGEVFLLEVSTNGGSSYSIYRTWISGTDFTNDTRYQESVVVSGIAFSTNTRFRFRCDASNNGDEIFMDDVVLTGCGNTALQQLQAADKSISYEFEAGKNAARIKVYPNPARQRLFVQCQDLSGTTATMILYDIKGRAVYRRQLNTVDLIQQEIDVSEYQSGIYYLQVRTDKEALPVQRVVLVGDR